MQQPGALEISMRKDSKPTAYPGVRRIGPGLYRIRVVWIDPKTGRRRETDRQIEASAPQDAAAIREQLRQQLAAGGEPATRPRLSEYARSWASGRAASLKLSTRERYALALESHILPYLGDHFVDAITPGDLVAWRDQQVGPPATVNGRIRVLKTLFADAVQDLELARNPAARLRALKEPERTEDTSNRLTAPELAALLAHVREHAPQWHAFFLAGAFTGARFGEISALRWEDIDHERGVIHIRRSQWHKEIGKTKTGRTRTVAMVPILGEAMRQHRRRMIETQHPGLEAGWCFPSDVGDLRFPSSTTKPLRRALAAIGVTRRVTFHGLRRTFNNLARRVTSGEVVRSIVGHTKEAMTEHYSWVESSEKRAAAAAVVALVHSASGDSGGDSDDGTNKPD